MNRNTILLNPIFLQRIIPFVKTGLNGIEWPQILTKKLMLRMIQLSTVNSSFYDTLFGEDCRLFPQLATARPLQNPTAPQSETNLTAFSYLFASANIGQQLPIVVGGKTSKDKWVLIDKNEVYSVVVLHGLRKMTNAGLKTIASSSGCFYNLLILDLYMCTRIDDEGIQMLGDNAETAVPSLEKVSMAQCELVSDVGIIALAVGVKTLKHLNVAGTKWSVKSQKILKEKDGLVVVYT